MENTAAVIEIDMKKELTPEEEKARNDLFEK